MTRKHVVIAIAVVWGLSFVMAFSSFFWLEPTGDGFTRGLNRIASFLGWQALAFTSAIACFVIAVGRFPESAGWRWLSRVPAIVQLVLVVAIATLIVVSIYIAAPRIDPSLPSRPTTLPAPAAAVAAEAEPERQIVQYGGIYRSGFEASHFYTMDGDGPWWMEVEDDALSEEINSHYVDGPGRSGGVTLAISVSGWLEDAGTDLAHLGDFDYRLHVTSIEAIRALSPSEFDQVLSAILGR